MSSETDRHASVESAISRVLAAERDVLDEIAACERRADEVLRSARKTVRELVRHTQERITRLHADAAAKTDELVRELEAEATTHQPSPGSKAARDQRLAEAIRRVACELTGQGADDVD